MYQDVSSHFLLRKFVSGLSKLSPSLDTRVPITPFVLSTLFTAIPGSVTGLYFITIYRAMITLSFFGLLRPGEVTDSPNNIQYHNVWVYPSKVVVTFNTFKHYTGPPVVIEISRSSTICPVKAATLFLTIRGSSPGPFFCDPEGFPISYHRYNAMFSLIQQSSPLPVRYHLHGLCIGSATYSASQGVPDNIIHRMGRWRSDAVKKYIRITSFTV